MALRKQGGFLIFFVAAALSAASAVFLAQSVFGTSNKSLGQARQTQTNLAVVERALTAYLATSRRLPCPASASAGTGVEAVSGGTGCGFPDGTTDGVLPWTTLGLRQADVLDGWGRYLSYRPFTGTTGVTQSAGLSMTGCSRATSAAADSAGKCTTSGVSTGTTQYLAGKGLYVCSDAANCAGTLLANPLATPSTGAAYVLISHGPDGLGGTSASGLRANNPTQPAALRNASLAAGGGTTTGTGFVVMPTLGDQSTAEASRFDDLVSYRSIAQMITQAGQDARPTLAAASTSLPLTTNNLGTTVGGSSSLSSTGTDGSGNTTGDFSTTTLYLGTNGSNPAVTLTASGGENFGLMTDSYGSALLGLYRAGTPSASQVRIRAGQSITLSTTAALKGLGLTLMDVGREGAAEIAGANSRARARVTFYRGDRTLGTVTLTRADNWQPDAASGNFATYRASFVGNPGSLPTSLSSVAGVPIGNFLRPEGATFDAGGQVYVWDRGDTGNTPAGVKVFNADGTPATNIGRGGTYGTRSYSPGSDTVWTGNGLIDDACAVVRDSQERIFISDFSMNPGRVVAFNRDGSLATGIGTGGFISSGSLLTGVCAMAISADSSLIYMANWSTGRIYRYTVATNSLVEFLNLGSNPYGVAVDNSGNVYIARYSANDVRAYTPAGAALTSFGTSGVVTGVTNPGKLTIVGTRLYVTQFNGIVRALTLSTGAVDTSVGSPGGQFSYPGGCSQMTGHAVSQAGEVYLVCRNLRQLAVVNSAGTLQRRIGVSMGASQAPNPYNTATSVPDIGGGVAPYGSTGAFVALPYFRRVLRIDGATQTVVNSGTQLPDSGNAAARSNNNAWDMGMTADTSGNLYVAVAGNSAVSGQRVYGFNTSLTALNSGAFSGTGYISTGRSNLTVNVGRTSGNLYVTDYVMGSGAAYSYSASTGALVTTYGSGLNEPADVAANSAETLVYVLESNNAGNNGTGRVTVYNNAGVLDATRTAQFATSVAGLSPAGFRYPFGITVDSTGRVYVADTGRNRVVAFNADGTLASPSTITVASGTNEPLRAPWSVRVNSNNKLLVGEQFGQSHMFGTSPSINQWGYINDLTYPVGASGSNAMAFDRVTIEPLFSSNVSTDSGDTPWQGVAINRIVFCYGSVCPADRSDNANLGTGSGAQPNGGLLTASSP